MQSNKGTTSQFLESPPRLRRHVTKKGCNNYSTTIIVLLCVDCINEESGNETEGFETSLIAGNSSV